MVMLGPKAASGAGYDRPLRCGVIAVAVHSRACIYMVCAAGELLWAWIAGSQHRMCPERRSSAVEVIVCTLLACQQDKLLRPCASLVRPLSCQRCVAERSYVAQTTIGVACGEVSVISGTNIAISPRLYLWLYWSFTWGGELKVNIRTE